MAANALVDAGFLVALISRRDANHRWAAEEASRFPPPWMTCEAVLSETFQLIGGRGTASVAFSTSACRRNGSSRHPKTRQHGQAQCAGRR